MTKWEYMRRRILYESPKGNNEELIPELNRWGGDGWELVHCDIEEFSKGECFAFCIFKRPLVESVPQNVFMISEPGSTISRAEIIFDDDDASGWDDVWQKLDSDERTRD